MTYHELAEIRITLLHMTHQDKERAKELEEYVVGPLDLPPEHGRAIEAYRLGWYDAKDGRDSRFPVKAAEQVAGGAA
jgi:hypothetical protein